VFSIASVLEMYYPVKPPQKSRGVDHGSGADIVRHQGERRQSARVGGERGSASEHSKVTTCVGLVMRP
jgi:hypothetical protein